MTNLSLLDPCIDAETLTRFRNSLREGEQAVLDEMLTSSSEYYTAINESGHSFPYPMALLAMLLESRREIQRLRREVAELRPQ